MGNLFDTFDEVGEYQRSREERLSNARAFSISKERSRTAPRRRHHLPDATSEKSFDPALHLPGMSLLRFWSKVIQNSGILIACTHHESHAVRCSCLRDELNCIVEHPSLSSRDEIFIQTSSSVRRIDVPASSLVETCVDFSGKLTFFAMSSSRTWLAYGSRTMLILKHEKLRVRWKVWDSSKNFYDAKFSLNERWIFLAGSEGLYVFVVPTREAVRDRCSVLDNYGLTPPLKLVSSCVGDHKLGTVCLNLSLNGSLAVVASTNGGILVYDLRSSPHVRLAGHLDDPTLPSGSRFTKVPYAEFSPSYHSANMILFGSRSCNICLAEVTPLDDTGTPCPIAEASSFDVNLLREIVTSGETVRARFHPVLHDAVFFLTHLGRNWGEVQAVSLVEVEGSQQLARFQWKNSRKESAASCGFAFSGRFGERLCIGLGGGEGLLEISLEISEEGDEGDAERIGFMCSFCEGGRIRVLGNAFGADSLVAIPSAFVHVHV